MFITVCSYTVFIYIKLVLSEALEIQQYFLCFRIEEAESQGMSDVFKATEPVSGRAGAEGHLFSLQSPSSFLHDRCSSYIIYFCVFGHLLYSLFQ